MPFVIIRQMFPKEYNLPPYPSDQLAETVTHVNFSLEKRSITPEEADRLISEARATEACSQFYGLPLENGSAQTPQLEGRRAELLSRR